MKTLTMRTECEGTAEDSEARGCGTRRRGGSTRPWFARGTFPDRAWYGGPRFGAIGNPPEQSPDRYDAGYGRGGDRQLRQSAGRYDDGFREPRQPRKFRPGERWPGR